MFHMEPGMNDDSLRYSDIQIVYDHELPPSTYYLIPPEAARAMEEARAVLGRGLTLDERLSCLIHRSAKLVLDEDR